MYKIISCYRFSSKLKLTGTNAYQKVLDRKFIKCGNDIITYYVQNQLENPRLGVLVPKRVSKKAVVRNYLKRMVRESFRCAQHQLKKLDIVVIIRHFNVNSNLQKQLGMVWKKLGQ